MKTIRIPKSEVSGRRHERKIKEQTAVYSKALSRHKREPSTDRIMRMNRDVTYV